jgi:hypothetical protein
MNKRKVPLTSLSTANVPTVVSLHNNNAFSNLCCGLSLIHFLHVSGLDDPGSSPDRGKRFFFSFPQRLDRLYGPPMGNGGSFPGGKAAGT